MEREISGSELLKTSEGHFYCKREVLGKGGNAVVLRVFDGDARKYVALKCQKPGAMADLEAVILKQLQWSKHCPRFYGKTTLSFRNNDYSTLSLQLLGKNLYDLQRIQNKKSFIQSTCFRLTLQSLKALCEFHETGYVHNDITPSNFVVGCDETNKHVVYLIDYGLAEKFQVEEDGNVTQKQSNQFVGTARYASPRAHNLTQPLSRRDDLISLFFVMVEMVNGFLPWDQLGNDHEQVGAAKRDQDLEELIVNIPASIHDFLSHIKELGYFRGPNYKYLRQCLLATLKESLLRERGSDFDWHKFVGEEVDFMDKDLM